MLRQRAAAPAGAAASPSGDATGDRLAEHDKAVKMNEISLAKALVCLLNLDWLGRSAFPPQSFAQNRQ